MNNSMNTVPGPNEGTLEERLQRHSSSNGLSVNTSNDVMRRHLTSPTSPSSPKIIAATTGQNLSIPFLGLNFHVVCKIAPDPLRDGSAETVGLSPSFIPPVPRTTVSGEECVYSSEQLQDMMLSLALEQSEIDDAMAMQRSMSPQDW